jgi:glycosyltransferase involved in cell wall biosynthesis
LFIKASDDFDLENTSRFKNIEIVKLPNKLNYKFNLLNVIINEFQIFKKIQKSLIDTLIVSSVTPRDLYSLLIFGRYRKIYFLHTVPRKPLWKHRFFDKILILARNYSFITVSNYAKKTIIDYLNIKKNKIFVLPNYVEIVPTNSKLSTEEIEFYKNKKLILTIGSLENYKNPKTWIETAKIVVNKTDCIFVWIGAGSRLKSLKNEIIKKGLHKRVFLLGQKNNVLDYLKYTDVYFQPSVKESQGIAIIEAMKCGVVCVASNVEGISETITNNINGITCDVNDSKQYSLAIVKLLNDDFFKNRLVSSAKRDTDLKFSKFIYLLKLNNILKNNIKTNN